VTVAAPGAPSQRTSSNHDEGISTETPTVVFDEVSLSFGDNAVLREVSFAVRPGRMTILIGASGAGKSVVLNIVIAPAQADHSVVHLVVRLGAEGAQ